MLGVNLCLGRVSRRLLATLTKTIIQLALSQVVSKQAKYGIEGGFDIRPKKFSCVTRITLTKGK